MEENKIKVYLKPIINLLKKQYKWIIVLIAIALFLGITEEIFEHEIHYFDQAVYQSISPFIGEGTTAFLKGITFLGSATTVIVLCVLAFALFPKKKFGRYMTINLIAISLCNQVMKYIFQRPRPEGFRLIDESGYSFPSGHSMVSMAFYGLMIYLVYYYVENKKIKWTLCTFLALLICFIGISRIYLGVHYASDVLGGFFFSIAYLVLYTNMIKRKVITKEEKEG